MLKGISPLLPPDLLADLCRMGHGDTLVLADAFFPGESLHPRVHRTPGIPIDRLLDAILPLLELDPYVEEPVLMMAPAEGDTLNPEIELRYRKAMEPHHSPPLAIGRVERFAFYDLARGAFAVVMTGEIAPYGNILLRKGVTPVGRA